MPKGSIVISDFRASLYDLFGYLLPGIVAFVGVILILESMSFLQAPKQILALTVSTPLVGLLLIAYILGHLCQAGANHLPGLRITAEDLIKKGDDVPRALLERAQTLLARRVQIDLTKVPMAMQLRMMDEAIPISSGDSEREIFIYREGFYRGMAVASALLLISCLSLSIRADAVLSFVSSSLTIPRSGMLSIAGFVAGSGCAFVARFRRFGRYRIGKSLAAYIMHESSHSDTVVKP